MGTLGHCCWERKLLQPGKTVWKLKIKLPRDPAVPLLGIYPKKSKSLPKGGVCTPTFTAALFAIAKVQNQSKVLWVDD